MLIEETVFIHILYKNIFYVSIYSEKKNHFEGSLEMGEQKNVHVFVLYTVEEKNSN